MLLFNFFSEDAPLSKRMSRTFSLFGTFMEQDVIFYTPVESYPILFHSKLLFILLRYVTYLTLSSHVFLKKQKQPMYPFRL